MPVYRLAAPGQPVEVVHADNCRDEGAHTVLRGTVLVIGQPREVVLRGVPACVRVELVEGS